MLRPAVVGNTKSVAAPWLVCSLSFLSVARGVLPVALACLVFLFSSMESKSLHQKKRAHILLCNQLKPKMNWKKILLSSLSSHAAHSRAATRSLCCASGRVEARVLVPVVVSVVERIARLSLSLFWVSKAEEERKRIIIIIGRRDGHFLVSVKSGLCV